MLHRQLRFRDLKSRGVVDNWVTLNSWIDNEGFPPGRLIGPNIRTWNEPDVVAWLESRPTDRKPARVRAIA
jgi:predicted DNA-binding transcriptional regulator AlpA